MRPSIAESSACSTSNWKLVVVSASGVRIQPGHPTQLLPPNGTTRTSGIPNTPEGLVARSKAAVIALAVFILAEEGGSNYISRGY
jgi:hypothetical protein